MHFLQESLLVCLLVSALSVDAFVASIAYGANKIQVNAAAAATINGIGSAFLGISLCAGRLLTEMLPPLLTKQISTMILVIIGLVKLFDSIIKSFLSSHESGYRCFRFTFSDVHFVLRIYADPIAADQDDSRSLSIRESAFLAVAMSLDSMVAGVGAAFSGVYALMAVALSFVIGMLVVMAGCIIGQKLSGRLQQDITWIGGAMFLMLAVLRWI